LSKFDSVPIIQTIVRTNYRALISFILLLLRHSKHRYFHACIIVLMTLVFEVSSAQSDTTSSVGRNGLRITNSEGLSQGFVYYLFQDSYGFIWMGTKDGLNRYDGYEFKIFRNNPDDLSSIGSNESLNMHEDQYQNLWINTISKGVDCYIRELDIFLHFNTSNSEYPISDNQIYWMTMHGGNEIWLCNNKSIDVITIDKKENNNDDLRLLSREERVHATYSFRLRHYPLGDDAQLKELNAQPFTNNTMMGTYNGQPCMVRLKDSIELEPLNYERTAMQHADSSAIKMILCDPDRSRLYLFYKNYIRIWNESTGDIKRIPNEFPGHVIPKRSGHIDQEGNIWSAYGGIVYCLKYDSPHYDTYVLDDLNSPVSAGLAAMSFLVDRSGLWWIGTPGYGVIKYNPDIELFHHSRGVDNSSRSFYSIYAGPDSIAYVMGGKSIWQFNLQKQVLTTPLPAQGFEANAFNGKLSGHAMVIDSLGNRWIAHGIDLFYIDYKKNTCRSLHKEKTYGFTVYTPLLEARDHSIWYGTALNLLRFTSPDLPPEQYQIPEKFRNWPDVPFIHGMIENGDYIWLATVTGVFGFHKYDHSWTPIVPIPGDKSSLSAYRVYAITPDPLYPDVFLWAGLNGGGLCRVNLQTFEIKKFTTQDGLPNDVIYGILADDNGMLWVSSNSGISCLQPGYSDQVPWLSVMRNFTSEDGLQSNEFNRYSFYKSRDGLMLFGGVNGINSFYPDEVLKKNNPPAIAITDIRIRNKSLRFGNPGDELLMSPITARSGHVDNTICRIGIYQLEKKQVQISIAWIVGGMD
jgi:Two component regulator propeller